MIVDIDFKRKVFLSEELKESVDSIVDFVYDEIYELYNSLDDRNFYLSYNKLKNIVIEQVKQELK